MKSFSEKVYQAVLSIPLGEVRSYQWVAKKAGSPYAYRAVGQVLKNNPYPLIIPCHRVIRNSGDIGGYVFGIRKKKSLLKLEKKLKECLPSKE